MLPAEIVTHGSSPRLPLPLASVRELMRTDDCAPRRVDSRLPGRKPGQLSAHRVHANRTGRVGSRPRFRGPPRLRGRRARARGAGVRSRDPRRLGSGRLGSLGVRLRTGRGPGQREPEPVAPGPAQQPTRALSGGRPGLPGAGLRPGQPDDPDRGHGLDPRRPTDLPRDGSRRTGPRTGAPRGGADPCGDPHP
jgi:hypothetical protein